MIRLGLVLSLPALVLAFKALLIGYGWTMFQWAEQLPAHWVGFAEYAILIIFLASVALFTFVPRWLIIKFKDKKHSSVSFWGQTMALSATGMVFFMAPLLANPVPNDTAIGLALSCALMYLVASAFYQAARNDPNPNY